MRGVGGRQVVKNYKGLTGRFGPLAMSVLSSRCQMATKEQIWKCAKKFLGNEEHWKKCREDADVPADQAPSPQPSSKAKRKRGGRVPGKIPKKSTVAIKGTDGSAIITGVNRETARPPRKGGPLPGVSRRTARELHRMMEQANVQLKQPYRDLGAVNKTRITAADLTRFTKILHSPAGLSILTQGENPNASRMVHQTARPGTAEMVSAAAATPPAATERQSQSPSALPAGLSQARLQEHDKEQQPPAPLVRAQEEDTDYESLLDDDDDDDDDDDGDEVQVVEDGGDNRPTQPDEALRLGVPVKRPAPSDRDDPSAKKPRVGAASTNAPSSARHKA